jgi:hypothetical protein
MSSVSKAKALVWLLSLVSSLAFLSSAQASPVPCVQHADGTYTGDCESQQGSEAGCHGFVGFMGATFLGDCVTTGTPPPPPAPTVPPQGCPMPAQPDSLNPTGSPWLFYGYRKLPRDAAGRVPVWTPTGVWTPSLFEFRPGSYLLRSCRNPARPWGAAFRGWPLPPGFHCGDSGSYSQHCDSASSWNANGEYIGP